jgi:hypothetical protein
MPANTILLEVRRLNDVSDRLDYFAGQHPVVSERLLAISGNIRSSVTSLEVLFTTEMSPCSGLRAGQGPHAAMEDRTIRSGEDFRCHSGRLW